MATSTTALDEPTFCQQASMHIMAAMMADPTTNYNLDHIAARAWAASVALWNTYQGSNPEGGDSTDTGSTTVDDDT